MDGPEQLQLFDTGPMTKTRPTTSSERMVAARDARTPAQRKRDANRELVAGTSPGTASRYGAQLAGSDEPGEDTHVSNWGMPVRGAAAHLAKLSPFDDPTFRRYGKEEWMPTWDAGTVDQGGWGVGQSHVNADRVHELAHDPSKGSNPRFPGEERPLVAPVNFLRNGRTISAPVVHNGTHRVAAAVERGQLFVPVTAIPKENMPQAINDARDRADRFRGSRQDRAELQYHRMMARDATVGSVRNPL